MKLSSPIWQTRFIFYVIIYFFCFIFVSFFLYKYDLSFIFYPISDPKTIAIEKLLYFIIFLFFLVFLFIKRIKDLKNVDELFFLLFFYILIYVIINIFFVYILNTYNISYYIKHFFINIFILIINILYLLFFIIILSFKKGNINENFNLKFINNTFLWVIALNKSISIKLKKNTFIKILYKYIFISYLFFSIFVVLLIDSQWYLFKYKWYENYSNTIILKSELENKFWEKWVLIKDDNKIYLKWSLKKIASKEIITREQLRIENEVKDYLFLKIIWFSNKAYLIFFLYIIIWIFFLKILPNFLFFLD